MSAPAGAGGDAREPTARPRRPGTGPAAPAPAPADPTGGPGPDRPLLPVRPPPPLRRPAPPRIAPAAPSAAPPSPSPLATPSLRPFPLLVARAQPRYHARIVVRQEVHGAPLFLRSPLPPGPASGVA